MLTIMGRDDLTARLSELLVNQLYANETFVDQSGMEPGEGETPMKIDVTHEEHEDMWRSSHSEDETSSGETIESSAEEAAQSSAEGSAEGSAETLSGGSIVSNTAEGSSEEGSGMDGEPVFRWKLGESPSPFEFTPNVSGTFFNLDMITCQNKSSAQLTGSSRLPFPNVAVGTHD
ncbi:hypothetical protein COOONC_17422 [Cooperia oncophora]